MDIKLIYRVSRLHFKSVNKKQILKLCLIVLLLFLCWMKIYWLAIASLLLVALNFLLYKFFHAFNIKQAMSKSLAALFISLVLVVFLRVFLFDIYSISSGSMENTIVPGDKIVVNKLIFGPEIPRSVLEIPWLNLLFINYKSDGDHLLWDYRRLSGYRRNCRGRVMVFRHPTWKGRDNFFVKRCVGIPGDTLEIRNGHVMINHRRVTEWSTEKKTYLADVKDAKKFYGFVNSLSIEITDWKYKDTTGTDLIGVALTDTQAQELLKSKWLTSLYLQYGNNGKSKVRYPHNEEFCWTLDNYGPIVIPKQGMCFPLNHFTFQLYEQPITNLEKATLHENNGVYFLNDRLERFYTFKHNYYFMLGDNRDNSEDSRKWGLVPEENIVGEVSLVAASTNNKGFNIERLLKSID